MTVGILPDEIHELITDVNTDESLSLEDKWAMIAQIVGLYENALDVSEGA